MISLWDVAEKLVEREYEEKRFYMRKLPGARQE